MKEVAVVLLIVASCSRCERPLPPPDAPPSGDAGAESAPLPTGNCEAACARFTQWGCKEAEEVCDAFTDAGVCSKFLTCTEACQKDPHAYPDPECVSKSAVAGDDPCAAVAHACERK